MVSLPFRKSPIVFRLATAIAVVIAALAVTGHMTPTAAASSSKPKEIVVVGSKIKDVVSPASIHFNANIRSLENGTTNASGHVWIVDVEGNRLGGPILGAQLFWEVEDGNVCSSTSKLAQFAINGNSPGLEEVTLDITVTPTHIEECNTGTTGNGTKVSESILGEFQFVVEVRGRGISWTIESSQALGQAEIHFVEVAGGGSHS